jgi:hypothetical protein
MTTYIHDNTTFTPAQIFQGVRLVKGKICASFYSDKQHTRTVVPTIIKAPNGELHGFYYAGGLDKTKKFVSELLTTFGAKIENEVIVIDATQFNQMADGSNGHFRMWANDAQAWNTSGVNDFSWNATTRQYEYTPKVGA